MIGRPTTIQSAPGGDRLARASWCAPGRRPRRRPGGCPAPPASAPAPSASRSIATSSGLHTRPSAPASSASRASRSTCSRGRAGDAGGGQRRRIQAGQHGHRQQQRPRLRRPPRPPAAPRAIIAAPPAACSVSIARPQRQHRAHRAGDRVGDVVQLQVEEDRRARRSRGTPAGAVGQEELQAQLEQAAMRRDRLRPSALRPGRRRPCRARRSAGSTSAITARTRSDSGSAAGGARLQLLRPALPAAATRASARRARRRCAKLGDPDEQRAEQEGQRHAGQDRPARAAPRARSRSATGRAAPAARVRQREQHQQQQERRRDDQQTHHGSGLDRRSARPSPARGILPRLTRSRSSLPALKNGTDLLVHRHRLAGARVAAGAGIAPLHREGAEAAQLHPLAARQRGGDFVEDRWRRSVSTSCARRCGLAAASSAISSDLVMLLRPRSAQFSRRDRLPDRPGAVKPNALGNHGFPKHRQQPAPDCADEHAPAKLSVATVLDRQVCRHALVRGQPGARLLLAADGVDQAELQRLPAGIGAAVGQLRAPAPGPCAARRRPCRRTGRTCPSPGPAAPARPSGDSGWVKLGWSFSGPETIVSAVMPSLPSRPETSPVSSSTPIEPVSVASRAKMRVAGTAIM